MNSAKQLAKHLRDIHFGGNWTTSSLKEHLSDIHYELAIKKVYSFNSIAELVFHMNYFVGALIKVLQEGILDAQDKYSFDCPPITTQKEWEELLAKTLKNADHLAILIEHLPEQTFWEEFTDSKYGNYYRNILGVIEHCHYHLGQIVIIKKLITELH
jgi:uncharacterized damage-inducible protein DinB